MDKKEKGLPERQGTDEVPPQSKLASGVSDVPNQPPDISIRQGDEQPDAPDVQTLLSAVRVIAERTHIGPWPSPETMEGYAKINPEFPDIIVKDFQEQGIHERKIDKWMTVANIVATFVGMAAGFSIAVLGLVLAAYVGLKGAWPVAIVLGGGTLVGLVAVFVTGSRQATKAIQAIKDIRKMRKETTE